MSRVRFTLIRAMLHFCNDEESSSKNSEKHNRLFKVRLLLDVLVPKFSALYKPDKQLAIHEMTIACNQKSDQRTRKKPIQWTDKVIALTEAKTGYLLEWAIHAGSSRETEKGASIVRKLCTPYVGKHDIYINTANSYTNRNLAKEFIGQTNGSGGIPRELKTTNENNNPVCAQSAVRRSEVKVKSVTQKGNKRSYNDMKKANSGKRYKYLSGVIPISRQLHLFRHKTQRWSLRIFDNLAQICVVNSHILYTSKTSDSSDKMDLKKYIEACVSGLLVDYNPHITEKWRPPQPGAVLSRILPPEYVHKIIKTDKKPQCVVCSDSRRKLGRRQTSFMCEKCNVALCAVPCFHRYHTLKNYRVCHLDM
ncbi:piggyBac transposable element-derived protein 4 [Ciona intestinalis]